MDDIFQTILNQLRHNQPVALATVVARKGSLPMSTRAKMAILADGRIAGTIGGGKLEASVIHTAVTAMQGITGTTAALLPFELTADQVESDGLTCGGTVEIFLEYFDSATSLPMIEALAHAHEQERPAVTVAILPGGADSQAPAVSAGQRVLIHDGGTLTGSTGKPAIDDDVRRFAFPYVGKDFVGMHELTCRDGRTVRVFLETIVPRPTAYLFGGGHVSYQVARLLPMLDFDFVVVDDREAFANQQRFPNAKGWVVHDFFDIFSTLSLDPRFAYIIIVTRGHQSDFQVLQQALRVQPAYIGMIGSRRKIQLLFEELRRQGVSQEALNAIHAPIGVEIGADTPEEIAVSIVAELIQVRRKKN